MPPLECSVSKGGLGHGARLPRETKKAPLGVLQDLAPGREGLEALPARSFQRVVNLLDLIAGKPIGHFVVVGPNKEGDDAAP
eukprot:2458881-Pyramimonas_sp.AAC.1